MEEKKQTPLSLLIPVKEVNKYDFSKDLFLPSIQWLAIQMASFKILFKYPFCILEPDLSTFCSNGTQNSFVMECIIMHKDACYLICTLVMFWTSAASVAVLLLDFHTANYS